MEGNWYVSIKLSRRPSPGKCAGIFMLGLSCQDGKGPINGWNFRVQISCIDGGVRVGKKACVLQPGRLQGWVAKLLLVRWQS
jgi:hypothetical protein